ncbi:hypothetical protein ASE73_06410 [Sphingomonas sp. Leaf24]|uniref:SPOR domain-containing protein n=1 Tax=unclassified Sphingomonas TaxID=196159 RepID=UPI0006F5ED61|nr:MULTISPECIES: SPOR domain-containing protein [unclassified Sphingomonas]KQM18488.1 hypothetical protein ASE50_04925 [Sphingomonas sp. Leaf5]KQM89249.1 hypothetical protein ASE73_06410 [Sphingomonas sp. Leaf24]
MSLAVLLLIVGGQVAAPDALPVVHEQRLDEVGRAGLSNRTGQAMTVQHRTLPGGSYAEVTALDSGRTIIVLVEHDPSLSPDTIALLSPLAATAIGIGDPKDAQIRIRPAAPSPAEQAAIRAGSEVPRLAAPPSLLAALRRRLPSAQPVALQPVAVPRPVLPKAAAPQAAAPKPAPRPNQPVTAIARPAAGRWLVQVAALSDATRAATLAKTIDGVVRSAGRLYRVQAGPFPTRAAAETARAAIARRGFADARIIAQD